MNRPKKRSGRDRRLGSCVSLGFYILVSACSGTSSSTPTGPSSGSSEPSSALERDESVIPGQSEADAPAPERSSHEPEQPQQQQSNLQNPHEPEYPGPSITVEELAALGPDRSTSIGSPNTGRLEGGVPLPWHAPGLVSNPARVNPLAYFGTVEMVQSLVNAAAAVHARSPGGVVKINDLGFEAGGDIPHHGSHTAGRDVDVLFYLLDADGQPREGKGVPIDPEGIGWDFGDLLDPADDVMVRLDVPRTWQFLEALSLDESAMLQRIYVVEHVRTMLMEYAEQSGAPADARQRVGHMTCQPGTPHDDHLHLRFFCAPDDIQAGCLDKLPVYGWHRRCFKQRTRQR